MFIISSIAVLAVEVDRYQIVGTVG